MVTNNETSSSYHSWRIPPVVIVPNNNMTTSTTTSNHHHRHHSSSSDDIPRSTQSRRRRQESYSLLSSRSHHHQRQYQHQQLQRQIKNPLTTSLLVVALLCSFVYNFVATNEYTTMMKRSLSTTALTSTTSDSSMGYTTSMRGSMIDDSKTAGTTTTTTTAAAAAAAAAAAVDDNIIESNVVIQAIMKQQQQTKTEESRSLSLPRISDIPEMLPPNITLDDIFVDEEDDDDDNDDLDMLVTAYTMKFHDSRRLAYTESNNWQPLVVYEEEDVPIVSNPQTELDGPIVHFVFLSKWYPHTAYFRWLLYNSIRSAYIRLRPSYIYLHVDQIPTIQSPYYKLAMPMIDKVVIWNTTYSNTFPQIPLNKFSGVEHVTDVIRLLALYKYGGVYFDSDILSLKSIDPYYFSHCSNSGGITCTPRNSTTSTEVAESTSSSKMMNTGGDDYHLDIPDIAILGYEGVPTTICNAFIAARQPKSTFIENWLKTYQFLYIGEYWNYNSGVIPFKLGHQIGNKDVSIMFLNKYAYFWPDMFDSTYRMFEIPKDRSHAKKIYYDFEQNYGIHMGNHAWSDWLSNMTSYTIYNTNNGASRILRPLLPQIMFSIVVPMESKGKYLEMLQDQSFPLFEVVTTKKEKTTLTTAKVEGSGTEDTIATATAAAHTEDSNNNVYYESCRLKRVFDDSGTGNVTAAAAISREDGTFVWKCVSNIRHLNGFWLIDYTNVGANNNNNKMIPPTAPAIHPRMLQDTLKTMVHSKYSQYETIPLSHVEKDSQQQHPRHATFVYDTNHIH